MMFDRRVARKLVLVQVWYALVPFGPGFADTRAPCPIDLGEGIRPSRHEGRVRALMSLVLLAMYSVVSILKVKSVQKTRG